MTEKDMAFLARRWGKLKKLETKLKNERAIIEDTILSNFKFDGKKSKNDISGPLFPYVITVSNSETVKVDGNLLQELANIHGLENELTRLFRWKPELEKAAWKTAPSDVKEKLLPAISTKKGRPSFKIEEVPF